MKKRKIILTFTSSLLLVGSVFTMNSCGTNSSVTINPFYSSFEVSDLPALQDIEFVHGNNVANVKTETSTGPIDGYYINVNNNTSTHQGFGFTGLNSFKYSASVDTGSQSGSFENLIYNNLNTICASNTELSYKIFPEYGSTNCLLRGTDLDLSYAATYTSIDLLFNDDDSMDNLKSMHKQYHLVDKNGYGITPIEQGESKVLYPGQWNSEKISLQSLAGRHIHAIAIHYDAPEIFNSRSMISGFVDDIRIDDTRTINGSSLTNYVDTRRGTNGGQSFAKNVTSNTYDYENPWTSYSRGNNAPLTCLPNGFNFYMPMTNAGTTSWPYKYSQGTIEHNSWGGKLLTSLDNRPEINGFGISHITSAWMGDHGVFSVMPQLSNNYNDYVGRALPFSHENEIAHPDYYAVKFDNGIMGEIVPSSHSAIFRFTFPNENSLGSLIIDTPNSTDGDPQINNDDFTMVVNNGGTGNTYGATPMYVYGKFSKPISSKVDRCATFNLNEDKTLQIKIATSFISNIQARHNFDLEIGDPNLSFDQLRQKATQTWNTKLHAIDLSKSNASDEQKETLYSNLYRLNCYPNEQFENAGTIDVPQYVYASPVPSIGSTINANIPITNPVIKNGKMYVNNGFWDTYRTVWPLYQILYPNFTKELINGFLLQLRDGGWVSRWSSPGYADCMTGTSSDCAFADAYLSGVIDDLTTGLHIYKSGYKDAYVDSESKYTGRKGLAELLDLGYVPNDYLDGAGNSYDTESISWSLEGYVNDNVVGQLAIKLANDPKLSDTMAYLETGQTKQEIANVGNELIERSKNYKNLFDPSSGFFRSKDDNNFLSKQNINLATPQGGTFSSEADFDPRRWFCEFTETNAWNFAFSVPHDVSGLISLYGGNDNFIAKLDEFFNTPDGHIPANTQIAGTPYLYGSDRYYSDGGTDGWLVHEMNEARDIRMGEWGINNQPSHHIPYMYAMAGAPSKTQSITRESLQRLFIGSDIGQGYPGDEDNGEMSSWYILSSLGLYHFMGTHDYIVTSPLYTNVTIVRDNNFTIKIMAKNNNNENIYINSAWIDNVSFNPITINQDILLSGNHVITYYMNDRPSN